MKRIYILLLCILPLACAKESPADEMLGQNAGIIATWVAQAPDEEAWTDDGARILVRQARLEDDRYGFIIREKGEFTERKNSGWCGTPPISYANFDGTWEALSDSLLQITVGYWGGVINYQIRIVDLQDELLIVRYLSPEDRAETK